MRLTPTDLMGSMSVNSIGETQTLTFIVDHLVFGQLESANKIENFNAEEVDCVKWADSQEINDLIESDPLQFTPWFRMVYKLFLGKPEVWRACSVLDQSSIKAFIPNDVIINED
jgi:isopentenyldiphosphate isomerase